MNKLILYFTTSVIILLFGACSNDALFHENDKEVPTETIHGTARTILLTASMPYGNDDNPTTRVSLTQQNDKAIELKWEADDELQIAFVQGETKIKSIAKVTSISDDGIDAQFNIVIPEQINSGVFNLYGVYGGEGLSDENPTKAILSKNSGDASSLASLEEKKHVMLYFASKDIEVTNPNITVIFQHLGSLFSITVKNASTTSLDNLAEARLVGVGGDGSWAFNSGVGGESYDLVSGEFLNIETAGDNISFKAAINSLPSTESITFWSWYPPLPNKKWPELKLQLRDATGTPLATTFKSKPARTSPSAAGMRYYFFAEWNGSELKFTGEPNDALVEEGWYMKETNGVTKKFFPIGSWSIPGYSPDNKKGYGDMTNAAFFRNQARNVDISVTDASFWKNFMTEDGLIMMTVQPAQFLRYTYLDKITALSNKGGENGYYRMQHLKEAIKDPAFIQRYDNDIISNKNKHPNVELAYLPIDEVAQGLYNQHWFTPPAVGDKIYERINAKDPNSIVFVDLAGHGKGSTFFFEKRYLTNHSSMPADPPYEAIVNTTARNYALSSKAAGTGVPLLPFYEGYDGVPTYKFTSSSYSYTSYTASVLKTTHYENIKAYAQAYKGNGNAFGVNAFNDFRDYPVLAGVTVDAIRDGLNDPTIPIWIFFDGNGYSRKSGVSATVYAKLVRCQMYTAIIHGATGIFFWNTQYADLNHDVWDAHQPAIEEIKGHYDIISLKTLEKRNVDNLHIMIKQDENGQKYILASNTSTTNSVSLNVDNVTKTSLAPLEVYVEPF